MSMFHGRQRFHDRSISLHSLRPLHLWFPFTRVFLFLQVSHWSHISSTDETQSMATAETSTAKQLWLDGVHPRPRCTQTCSVLRTSTTAETPQQRKRCDLALLWEESGAAKIHRLSVVEGKGKILLHH